MTPPPWGADGPGGVYDAVADSGYGEAYLGRLATHEDSFVLRRLLVESGILRNHIGRTPRVWDAGCGFGRLLELLPCTPDRYVGIDASRRMIERAKERHPAHRFVLGDFLSFTPGADIAPPDLITALWGPMNYAGLGPSLRWAARTLPEYGSLFAVLYGPRHEYLADCYRPEVRQSIPQNLNVTADRAAELALAAFGQSARIRIQPFSSEALAHRPDCSRLRFEGDRLASQSSGGKNARYLLLAIRRV